MSEVIYKNGCWGCKRALEWSEVKSANEVSDSKQDPMEKYVCPQIEQHRIEYEQERQSETNDSQRSKAQFKKPGGVKEK